MYRRVTAGEELEGIDRYRYFNTNWFDELYRDMAPTYKQICRSVAEAAVHVTMYHSHISARGVCGIPNGRNIMINSAPNTF